MSSQKCEATTSSENLPSLKKCKYGPLKHQCITVKTVQIQKCTFNSILLDNSIKPTLEDELTCINTITFEKAKLLELYLLDKLDREQQALSKMCQWIIGKPQDWHYSDIVVAYGSGVFSSSPGYASGPKNSYTKG
ncbi:14488_t:CDS:2 [Entrophospora sp. SA101]|nr:14488_t:CDS:2 [Entrophospora sp. SA101]